VRHAVKNLLVRSKSFAQLPAATREQIARDMALIGDYLAAPEGIPGNQLPAPVQGMAAALDTTDPSASTYGRDSAAVDKIGQSKFQAQAAREGAEVAGLLLQKVNFPTFCASLIQGVFHAIVQASIEQMEAYGKLVSSVAQSLSQFRDTNVSDNQGRDHMVDQFPDLFQIGTADDGSGNNAPRLQLRDGVDEDAALARVNERLPMEGGPLTSLDMSDDETEQKVTLAARNQLAASRQQLLATMVMMGINRIVVTDGKIQAKILYDFQARDNRKMQRSAVAYDYARDQSGNVQRTTSGEGTSEVNQEGGEYSSSRDQSGATQDDRRDGSYYAKGSYKYAEQPILTAMSTASETSDAALQTKASLAGVVDINFKSDYFPLEKMADSFQISRLQAAAQPGRGAAAAGAVGQPAAAPGGAPSATSPPAAGTGASGAAATPAGH
jgi:hypothetical protein